MEQKHTIPKKQGVIDIPFLSLPHRTGEMNNIFNMCGENQILSLIE